MGLSFRLLFTLWPLLLAFVAHSNTLQTVIITDQLSYPWGMAFINDDQVLVTEKPGSIKQITLSDGTIKHISGGPQVTQVGQGGLLDIEKHPRFDDNQLVYFSYSKKVNRGVTTAVARGVLEANRIVKLEDILITNAINTGGRHFGSRLAFDANDMLYVTVGDRGDRSRAQRLASHAGKVLRIHDDGKIPRDNPFLSTMNAQPEIYSYGHRNPQGLAFDSHAQRLWLHEHGPKGGDEVNLLQPGANYGWPIITYGREYSGLPITDETHREGMEQPIWKWVPSIAPSGLAVYHGNAFKSWNGDLLVGSLKFKLLAHLVMNGEQAKREQRYLESLDERIRAVKVGPQGMLYLLTDSAQGQLIKLTPKSGH